MATRKAAPPARAPRTAPGPPSRDAETTRERILSAAEEAFAAHGLRGARVQEIVARAGVNERMLYHYFGDKDGLYRAVLERFLGDISDRLAEALEAPAEGPEARLTEVIRRSFEGMASHPHMVRLFLHEALAGWPFQGDLAALQKEHDARLTPGITRLFVESEAAGIFRRGLDPRIAMLVAGACAFMLPVSLPRVQRLFQEDLRDPAVLSAVREQLIDTILHGIVGPRPEAGGPPPRKPRETARKPGRARQVRRAR